MCGIVGIACRDGSGVDGGVLQRMNDLQAHRGPDGEGFLFARWKGGRFEHAFTRRADSFHSLPGASVGLGQRRLAILDLSDRGLQPMTAADGRVWVTFNGEIYNYRELRPRLEAEGHSFHTNTDTEVLLAAYCEWGEACPEHLEGMFAFAIWDGIRGRLFCARDRLGIKPFYYAEPEGGFLFASEMKALLAYPGLAPERDHEAIVGFLVHGNCDYGERTLFRNVKALPAAHSLTLDLQRDALSIHRYWELIPRPSAAMSDRDAVDRLKALLTDSMRKHLNSDVRAGSCLSGGLDSSTVVGTAGNIWHEQPDAATAIGDNFFTFTSCYDSGDSRDSRDYRAFDEREYALAVAERVGATSHLVYPTPEDFLSCFQTMAWHQDMPFGSFSFYAQWRVMRAAREAGVKVLLDGQGGDEVFGGYAKFRYAYLASLLRSRKYPRMVRELAATIWQGDRYVLNIRNGYRYLPGGMRSLLQVDSLLKLALRADWNAAVADESTPGTRWWRNASRNHGDGGFCTPMQRIQVDDIVTDTLPTLLRLEDRSSMAFSIEARVPLLDHRLVEYGVSLPDHLKVRNGWSKFAVREAMRGLIPEKVRLRKSKLGFAAPQREWLADQLREPIWELVHDSLRAADYIDAAALRRWYRSPDADRANTESYLGLFRILSLEMWMRAFDVPRREPDRRVPAPAVAFQV
jgi:asparagine synthase (glutamine-hydrolysing)